MKKILAIVLTMVLLIGFYPTAVAHAGTAMELPLTAGQTTQVGTITVVDDGSNLTVTYATLPDWTLTETHLYIDTVVPKNAAPGRFPYKHTGLSAATDTYTIPISVGTTYHIAAHAVVQNDGSGAIVGWDCPTTDELNALLPTSGTMMVQRITFQENYWDVTISNAGVLNGTYSGWCLDRYHGILQDTILDASFYSSYETLPDYLTTGEFPTISYPGNMDLVNWVINHNDGYTIWETQNVIWRLLNMYEERSHTLTEHEKALYDESFNHDGFVPDLAVGEVTTFIAQPIFPGVIYQSILVELKCRPIYEYPSETAWAQGSTPFKTGWGTYFTYTP